MEECSATHCVQVSSATKELLTWAIGSKYKTGNRFGQLGRGFVGGAIEEVAKRKSIDSALTKAPILWAQAAAGGNKDSGHTAAVTSDGQVYTFGCDRWQQLGLGAAAAGSVGYAWQDGKIWQTLPSLVTALTERIHMVACGDDHTVALAHDGRSVYTWGRGEHGQLGHRRKMFVNAPARSALLSADSNGQPLDGVLARGNCTAAYRQGKVVQVVGKCAKVMADLERAAASTAGGKV
jgi:alpha-tubulin suppressor-like RCC1 family protein